MRSVATSTSPDDAPRFFFFFDFRDGRGAMVVGSSSAVATGAPQSAQNAASAGTRRPQDGHFACRFMPGNMRGVLEG